MQGEYWVVNNGGYVSGPYSDVLEAGYEAIKLLNDDTFEWKGNLCVVEVLGNYDNYGQSEEEHEN